VKYGTWYSASISLTAFRESNNDRHLLLQG